jgi:ribonuclease E
MPSQVKKVQAYKNPLPLFVAHKVEDQLSQIHSPVVPLRSGGYLVINQTEALVAIDVNSGKSTRERGIEATALKTNLEAADEAARQLRLRDLAGLIVIDFIDMDESKNNRAVEKRLKDALDGDRARLQMGKISPFGLMEISRQRRRTGVLEGTTHICPSCQGLGRIRSAESSALQALRALEIEIARDGGGEVVLRVPTPVALYILNEKRPYLSRLEQVQQLHVIVVTDESLGHAEHAIERISSNGVMPAFVEPPALLASAARLSEEDDLQDDDEAEVEEELEAAETSTGDADESAPRRGRRRRGGRRRGGEDRVDVAARSDEPAGDDAEDAAEPASAGERDEDGREPRRRRGRRGGRRAREEVRTGAEPYAWTRARSPDGADPYAWFDPLPPTEVPAEQAPPESIPAEAPSPTVDAPESVGEPLVEAPVEATSDPSAETPLEPPAKPARVRRPRTRKPKAEVPEAAEPQGNEAPSAETLPAPEALPDALPEPAPVSEPEAPTPAETDAAEPRPTPVLAAVEPEPEPEPAAPVAPDPSEITAPPATPRRGWWRRGA